MNVIFDYFSTLYKNFTIAMSLKYQVQDLLFNNDTTSEITILITFIIHLKYKLHCKQWQLLWVIYNSTKIIVGV